MRGLIRKKFFWTPSPAGERQSYTRGVFMQLWALLFALCPGLGSVSAYASLDESEVRKKIEQALGANIPRARIELPSLQKIILQSPLSEMVQLDSVRLLEDRTTGVAVVELAGPSESGRSIVQSLQTPYEAWLEVPVATRRIYPNTKLKSEDFTVRPINVASGLPREYRGVMITDAAHLDKMESRQTVLEGQYITRSAIQARPDVRKGEMVRLELVAGELSLVTQAVIQESAAIGSRVRVLTLKTKKELTGEVKSQNVVEVRL